MSSLDQAFVKAYARRVHNRPADSQPPAATPADSASSFVDDGTLHVNHSVAESTQVWIDPIEDQQIRADVAHPGPANRMAPPAPVPPAKRSRSERLTGGSQATPQPNATRTAAAASPPAQPAPATTAPAAAAPPKPPTNQVVNRPLLFEMETHTTGSQESNQHVHVAYALASLLETPAAAPQARPQADPAETHGQGNSAEPPGDEIAATTTVRIDPSHAAAAEPAPQPTAPATPAVVEQPAVEQPAVEQPAVEQPAVEQPAVVAPQVTAGPATPAHVDLNPVWEVDNFDIPVAVTELFFDSPLADQISRRMADAVKSGLGSVMVTSCSEGEGRSTVAMGVALAAARGGLRVCLIDGDLEQPTLLDDLRLDLESGWTDAIASGQSFDDVAVRSLHDRLTLIPLLAPSPHSGASRREISDLIDQLRESFDLLVIDAAASNSHSVASFAAVVETALIVRDTANTPEREINAFAEALRSDGVRGVGIVENFS